MLTAGHVYPSKGQDPCSSYANHAADFVIVPNKTVMAAATSIHGKGAITWLALVLL